MFSVVIPLYNKGHTVVDTVQSVLSQDFRDFEVVIVDDGSTDDGPDQIERLFDDPRIRLIRQENAGEGAARNAGIDAARYKWIAPLDADDFWLPGYLSQVKRAIQLFPNAGMFCCCSTGLCSDGSGYVRQSKKYGENPQKVDFYEAPFYFGNSSSIVFSKELVPIIGGFPVSMPHQADVTFFFSLALLTEVVFCPIPLSVYRVGVAGQISADRRANVAGAVESSNRIYQFWASLDPARRDPHCIAAVVSNLRGSLKYALASSDYDLVDYFLGNVNPRLLARLTAAERLIYPRRRLGRVSLGLNRAIGLRRRLTSPRAEFSNDATSVIDDARSQSALTSGISHDA